MGKSSTGCLTLGKTDELYSYYLELGGERIKEWLEAFGFKFIITSGLLKEALGKESSRLKLSCEIDFSFVNLAGGVEI